MDRIARGIGSVDSMAIGAGLRYQVLFQGPAGTPTTTDDGLLTQSFHEMRCTHYRDDT
jgi:hypothetical protein